MPLDFSAIENDDTISPREFTLRSYKVSRSGVIQDPGKFEGASVYAPFLDYLALGGLSDEMEGEDDTHVDVFHVDADLRRWFPELESVKKVRLWTDSLGCVHTELVI